MRTRAILAVAVALVMAVLVGTAYAETVWHESGDYFAYPSQTCQGMTLEECAIWHFENGGHVNEDTRTFCQGWGWEPTYGGNVQYSGYGMFDPLTGYYLFGAYCEHV